MIAPCLLATSLRAQTTEAAPVQPILPDGLVERILAEGLENSRVMDHLDGLTNVVGHRLTGSDNFTIATRWAKRRFEEMGLDNVHLEAWDTWPVTWNRGQWSGRIVSPESLELQVATSAWTPGTSGSVRARLLSAPSSEEDAEALDPADSAFRGAWLWVGEDTLVQTRRGSRRPRWVNNFARDHGVAGIVQSSSGSSQYPNRIRVFGNAPRTDDYEPPTMVDIVVRNDQAQKIEELLARSTEPLVAEFDIRNRFRDEPIELNNVIAEIPGSTKPDEVVIVCAHLDSWHQATGTTDNGTGSATTLEAARILAAIGYQPKRTIRFCLWGGEEQGLLGSQGYVRRHRTDMPKVSFVFNHDTGTNWWQNMSIDEINYPAMARVTAPFARMDLPDDPNWEGAVFTLDEVQAMSGGGGSDHASFLAAGVPAVSIGLKGESDYFGYTWHSQWDTFDVAIPAYQRHTATKLALAALGVAELPELLSHEGVRARGGNRGSGRQLVPALEGLLGLKIDASGPADDRKVVFTSVDEAGLGHKLGFRKDDQLVDVVGRGASLSVLWRIRQYDQDFTAKVKRGDAEVEIALPGGWAKRDEDKAETSGGGN